MLKVVGAFATGLTAGWIGRSLARSTRGLVVGLVAVSLRARDSMTRMFGHTAEWVEDVVAEGKARYESGLDVVHEREAPAAGPVAETRHHG
jgi:hypothetical protein